MKSTLKYIIIGASIIISSIIIGSTLQNISARIDGLSTAMYGTAIDNNKRGYGVDTYEQNLESAQTFTYKSPNLRVWKNGQTFDFSGEHLEAIYYHTGQMLVINYIDEEGNEQSTFFCQPDRWE
ncbi:MAG: hypothetical protein MI810_02805 [Flavobacteriales bacterium]|jgi:hypothetical protein|nr:hypothetical protein [Flavobacteriales bacterium]